MRSCLSRGLFLFFPRQRHRSWRASRPAAAATTTPSSTASFDAGFFDGTADAEPVEAAADVAAADVAAEAEPIVDASVD